MNKSTPETELVAAMAMSNNPVKTLAEWVGSHQGQSLNLSYAEMRGINLSGAVFREGTNLAGANLQGAILTGASLKGASLVGATLDEATLTGCDLTGADITDMSMNHVHLDPMTSSE